MSKSRIMDPCVPLPLDQKRLTDLVEKAKDYCLMHGERWNKNWAKTTKSFNRTARLFFHFFVKNQLILLIMMFNFVYVINSKRISVKRSC